MKVIYFDTETTGTNPNKNEIIQFAAIVEIDGVVVDEINVRCQPTNWDAVSEEALQVTGLTLETLKTYPTPAQAAMDIEWFFDKHIDKFNKADKFYPAGHNVSFDIDFLQAFWRKHISKYGIGSYVNWRNLDTRVLANFLIYGGHLDVIDTKLGTLCNHFGIELDAHDALNDIRATRELMKAMCGKFKLPASSEVKNG
jgi:DNA polymerase-3 subunit epsilon